MQDAVLISLVVAGGTVAGPLLGSWMNNRHLRAVKQDDYARQDIVAKRVEAIAAAAAEAARIADKKQDAIHSLVNSEMTARIQAELAATHRELATMRELVLWKETAGITITDETRAIIAATERRINELSIDMADRLSQTRIAEAAMQTPT